MAEHRCALAVRSYEYDSFGHVNNAVYLNYLELARHELLKYLGVSVDKLREAGYFLVAARVCIDYKLQAKQDDALTIATRPLEKGRTSGVFSQNIYRGDELVAQAEVTWACINSAGRLVRLPTELDIPELGS